MRFRNPSPSEIAELLGHVRTIAVVGLSPDPDRPSYSVAMYLQAQGYRIVPIRPGEGEILGERIYPSVAAVPFRIDLIDCFRRPRSVAQHVDEAIALRVPVWLQEGVVDEDAAERARSAGLFVAMDLCLLKEHRKAGLGLHPEPA